MMGYFQPLRRTIGVVTLAVASLLVAMWVRSHTTGDYLCFRNLQLISYRGGILWEPTKNWNGLGQFVYQEESVDEDYRGAAFHLSAWGKEWRYLWQFAGFGGAQYEYLIAARGPRGVGPHLIVHKFTRVPYWFPVMLLMLISAGLFLSRPRVQAEPAIPIGQSSTTGFFKSRRRKIGVVVLIFACVLAGGWVRSLFTTDTVLRLTSTKVQFLMSAPHGLVSYVEDSAPDEITNPHVQIHFGTPPEWDKDAEFDWRFQLLGFEFGERRDESTRESFSIIPYWPLVTSLTLLSAWLLLSKPRAGKLSADAPPQTEP